MGKLKSEWSSPFVVMNIYPSGAVKLESHEKRRYTINGQRLKYYHVGRTRSIKVKILHFKDAC